MKAQLTGLNLKESLYILHVLKTQRLSQDPEKNYLKRTSHKTGTIVSWADVR